ncbi:hypothetical protein BJX99DRAFT_225323 [Aspergillus californicus]
MSKRCQDDALSRSPPPKRQRTTSNDLETDNLSSLSNEILLHILSFLPTPSLLTCQSLSRRFNALSNDSELWKRQYFSKWVRPRARRLAITRRSSFPQSRFEYSPRVSTWLDHGHLDRNNRIMNWKRQYQLRHNWSKGTCRVTEVEIPQPPRPPILVTLCAGFVFTADSHGGLQAWSAENPVFRRAVLTFTRLESHSPIPTALTATCGSDNKCIKVVVGFEDGKFNAYRMDTKKSLLDMRFSRSTTAPGAITAMASSYPYLLVMSKHKVLSLYKLPLESDEPSWPDEAHLVTSLKTDSILSPMSLSVRLAGSDIIVSIVYSFFHIGCGWSLGIQELHFDVTGQQTSSRLTTTVETQYGVVHLPSSRYGLSSSQDRDSISLDPLILHQNPPTSVSYSHPYLLTSHADNTLTVYLIVSTADDLYVKGGQRLWGHTSSVSAVQVSGRGKAVSVSSHGDEVRIWELENLISSFGSHKILQGDKSIKVQPEHHRRSQIDRGLGLLSDFCRSDLNGTQSLHLGLPNNLAQARDCVGFDDERLLLLREREYGAQLLEFYDFT